MADNAHDTIQVLGGCAVVIAIVAGIAWGTTVTDREAIAAGYEQQAIVTPTQPGYGPRVDVVWRKAPAPAMVTAPVAEVETPK
jgi:hypothetical protein